MIYVIQSKSYRVNPTGHTPMHVADYGPSIGHDPTEDERILIEGKRGMTLTCELSHLEHIGEMNWVVVSFLPVNTTVLLV